MSKSVKRKFSFFITDVRNISENEHKRLLSIAEEEYKKECSKPTCLNSGDVCQTIDKFDVIFDAVIYSHMPSHSSSSAVTDTCCNGETVTSVSETGRCHNYSCDNSKIGTTDGLSMPCLRRQDYEIDVKKPKTYNDDCSISLFRNGLKSKEQLLPLGVYVDYDSMNCGLPHVTLAKENGKVVVTTDTSGCEGFYGRVMQPSSCGSDTSKKETRFYCNLCKSVLESNVHLMAHALSHYLHQSPWRSTLASLLICSICWRDFDNMVELQLHYSQVHTRSANSYKYVCLICEQFFGNEGVLQLHFRSIHQKQDMPYMCGVCNYRSSFYNDLWNHFTKEHCHTTDLLCPLCLKCITATEKRGKYKLCLPVSAKFFDHIKRHMEIKDHVRCKACKLMFLDKASLTKHVLVAHSKKSIEMNCETIRLVNSVDLAGKTYSLYNAGRASANRSRILPVSRFCVECRLTAKEVNHFTRREMRCGWCLYTSSCMIAYKRHLLMHQPKFAPHHKTSHFRPPILDMNAIGCCSCSFETSCGNRLAEHIINCSASKGVATLCKNSTTMDRNRQPDSPLLRSLGLQASS